MTMKIGVIFATRNAIEPIRCGFEEYAPDVAMHMFMDESLLSSVATAGKVTLPILRSFSGLLARAEDAGVNGILFSCSVFSPFVTTLQPLFSVPLLSVDSPMIDLAAVTPGTVGVITTVAQTEESTVNQIREKAHKNAVDIKIRSVVVPEAFAALPTAPDVHDKMIYEAAKNMGPDVDRYVLAQVSMARAEKLVSDLGKPVITSLKSGIQAIIHQIKALS